MNNVELVHARVQRGMMNELVRLRSWLSSADNHEAAELLNGKEGDAVLARMVEFLMAELGHKSPKPATDPQSTIRRLARGAMGLST